MLSFMKNNNKTKQQQKSIAKVLVSLSVSSLHVSTLSYSDLN